MSPIGGEGASNCVEWCLILNAVWRLPYMGIQFQPGGCCDNTWHAVVPAYMEVAKEAKRCGTARSWTLLQLSFSSVAPPAEAHNIMLRI